MLFKSERPVWRSIVKIFSTLVYGRAQAHAQDWVPGLALTLPAIADVTGSVYYRTKQIAALHHPAILRAAAGDDIFIVGSGPSLHDADISKLGRTTTILLNGAITLLGSGIDDPLAVAVEDERFVWRHFELMRARIVPGTVCLFSVAVLRAICEKDQGWLCDKTVIVIDDVRKPYLGRRRSHAQLMQLRFVQMNADGSAGLSLDPSKGVFQGGSVAISALQFALFCQPKRVGFFGVDISNADRPRFYEMANDMAKSGVAGAKGRILAHVALARRLCMERGIEVLNFSAVSALQECGLSYDDRYAKDRSRR